LKAPPKIRSGYKLVQSLILGELLFSILLFA